MVYVNTNSMIYIQAKLSLKLYFTDAWIDAEMPLVRKWK